MEEITRHMQAGEMGVARYVFKGTPKQCSYAPVPMTGWSVGAIRDGMLLIGGICLALALTGIIFFVRSINRPIMRVVSGLNEASDQVTSASTEVSSASQNLADGSSQQASSLEETSASLEDWPPGAPERRPRQRGRRHHQGDQPDHSPGQQVHEAADRQHGRDHPGQRGNPQDHQDY